MSIRSQESRADNDFKEWICDTIGERDDGVECGSACSSISLNDFSKIFRCVYDVYEDEALKHPNSVCRELCKWMTREIGSLLKYIKGKHER